MALDPGAMHARIIENLSEKTGQSPSYWLAVLDELGGERASQIAHLKSDHGLGHYTAVAIIREKTGDVPWKTPDELVASLRGQLADEDAALYNDLCAHLSAMDGVTMVPCKTYTGFKAKRQFAVLKPSKVDGLHIGFTLPVDADPCLQAAMSLGSERIVSKAKASDGEEKLKSLLEDAAQLDRNTK